MGLVLSKILPALLSAVSLTCLFCLAAGFLALRSKARSAAILSFIAAGILYVASSPIVSWALVRGLESRYNEAASYPRVPAIVLLGGAMMPDFPPRRHPEVNGNGDRPLQAARLWRKGLAPRLVVTGGSIHFITGSNKDEASLYARLLEELFDVPDTAVLKVTSSRNTYDDAVLTSRLFDSLGMKKEILLVTSAMHMPRSVLLFRKQGFIIHPAPADYHVGIHFIFKPINLIPSEEKLDETANALHEYIGLIAYYLMGRL